MRHPPARTAAISLHHWPCHEPFTMNGHRRPRHPLKITHALLAGRFILFSSPLLQHGFFVWSRFNHRWAGIHSALSFFLKVASLMALLVASTEGWLLIAMKILPVEWHHYAQRNQHSWQCFSILLQPAVKLTDIKCLKWPWRKFVSHSWTLTEGGLLYHASARPPDLSVQSSYG